MRVLVMGAGGAAGNNFVRSINDEYEVIGADIDPVMLHSSEAHELVLMDSPPAQRLRQVQEICKEMWINAIWAQPTPEVAFVSEHADKLDVATYIPPQEVIWDCNDKLVTAERLSGIAPHSAGFEHIDRFLTKYDEVWLRQRYGAGSAGALPVRSTKLAFEWMEHWYDTQQVTYPEWMIAKRLPGRDLSWTGLYDHGKLVISVAKERVRALGAESSPAQVSSTAKAQIVVKRPDMNAVAERALELMAGPDAHGVFMVDMRENEAGQPKVTEINAGRFGTTCDMYMHMGPNLPKIVLDLALGTYEGEYGRRDEHRDDLIWLRNADMRGIAIDQGDVETPSIARP